MNKKRFLSSFIKNSDTKEVKGKNTDVKIVYILTLFIISII